MPWSNNTGGGPWGNGGGGSRGGGPWGSGPQHGGGGNQPPDLEELFRRSQERLRNSFPSGRGNGVIAGLLILALLAVWLYASFYRVEEQEVGVELVFGEPKQQLSEAGLHFHFWPIETVEKVYTGQRQTRLGFGANRQARQASLMLSGDQNIVDVDFTVIYRVSDPIAFLFNVREPEEFVRRVAESAMREIVGRSRADAVRTNQRATVQEQVRQLIQTTLDAYGVGLTVVGVQVERADPPAEVADAFEEVQRAQQDQERFQREAERYANQRLGEARGEASRIREQALAYRNRVTAEAEGEAQRFTQILDEYAKAPDVTRRRLFLETMERVLGDSNKVILESGSSGSGVVPYLPLPEVDRRRDRATTTEQGS